MHVPLDNIERTHALSPETLVRRFLRTGTPVIVQGLGDHRRARALADVGGARRALADVPLAAGRPPISEMLRGRTVGRARPVRLGDLYDDLASGHRALGVCIEHPTPARLARRIPPPPYVRLGDPDDGWLSFTFMAGPGDVTHLHYDVDGRAFAMYQVFGHKRYVVIDPAHTRKLAPLTAPDLPYVSTVFLQHFDPADRAAFLRYTAAWEADVGPGETIVIPPGAWHHVEYLDVALSVSFRLPRPPVLRFLADELPPSVEVQALMAHVRNDAAIGPEEARALGALREAVARTGRHPRHRGDDLAAACAAQAARLGLPVGGPGYHLADVERHDDARARTAASGGVRSDRRERHALARR